MLDGLGAFANGLAEGIRMGEVNLRQQRVGHLEKRDAREAGLQDTRRDKADPYSEKRNRLRAANEEIVAEWQQEQQEQAVPPQQKQAAPSLNMGLPRASLALDVRGPGLSSLSKQASRLTPDEMIIKRMLTGNLLENPDELTRMANIYKKYGLLEEMWPWMNEVYTAKKKGIPNALNFLLAGDTKGARAVLERGGVGLPDDPVEIAVPDGRKNLWRFRLKDGDEKEIDLKELVIRFFPFFPL